MVVVSFSFIHFSSFIHSDIPSPSIPHLQRSCRSGRRLTSGRRRICTQRFRRSPSSDRKTAAHSTTTTQRSRSVRSVSGGRESRRATREREHEREGAIAL